MELRNPKIHLCDKVQNYSFKKVQGTRKTAGTKTQRTGKYRIIHKEGKVNDQVQPVRAGQTIKVEGKEQRQEV